MGKAMKAMKAMKSRTGKLSKGGIAEALATQHDLKRSICSKLLDTLAEIGASEVKSNGKFVLPGLCMIKTKEGGDQSGQEDDVRTGGSCQGEASEDCRQGFRRCGFEKGVQVIRAVVRENLAPPMIMETKATIDKEA